MKKYTAITLSIISVLISLSVACLYWIDCHDVFMIDSSSYISVVVTLLAIIVTIVLGWQIYNVIDYKEKVAEIGNLKKDYDLLKQNIEDAKLDVEFVACQTTALNFNNQQSYGFATITYMEALLTRLNKKNVIDVCEDFNWIFDELNKVSRCPFYKGDHSVMKKYIEKWNNEICSHKNYAFVKTRYEKFYKELFEAQHWIQEGN
ncbi:MAG: hypothetical protein MJ197_01535 [Bacteroidales bacterium]|nr:hypothetical protein [Bacteroidales bacterium]